MELQVQLRVAHLVARMELTRPEILRVTKVSRWQADFEDLVTCWVVDRCRYDVDVNDAMDIM